MSRIELTNYEKLMLKRRKRRKKRIKSFVIILLVLIVTAVGIFVNLSANKKPKKLNAKTLDPPV